MQHENFVKATRFRNQVFDFIVETLAGAGGFEPPYGGIKIRSSPPSRRSEFEASPAFRPRSRIARVAAESDPFGIARLAAAARSLNQDRRRHSRVSIPRQEPEFVTITE